MPHAHGARSGAGITKLYVMGNPGSGKSTFLNGLCGRAAFKAGVSIGNGLTSKAKGVAIDLLGRMVLCFDTPGLNDLTRQKECAAELSRVLKEGGDCKLVFVVKLDSGRMRNADVAVMHAILKSLEDAVKDEVKYVVVLNAVSKRVMEKRPDMLAQLALQLEELARGEQVPMPAGAMAFPSFSDAEDEDNYVFGHTEEERKAVLRLKRELQAAPSNRIQGEDVKDIELDTEKLRATEAKLQAAENRVATKEKEIAGMQRQLVAYERRRQKEVAELENSQRNCSHSSGGGCAIM